MDAVWQERKKQLGTRLLRALYEQRLLMTWLRDKPSGWELMSGLWSPFYITLRDIPARPELFRLTVQAAAELIRNEVPGANKLVGLAMTGIPIGAAIGYETGMPVGYSRKLPNVRNLADLEYELDRYGSHRLVEGVYAAGDRIALVDDVTSSFESKEIAIKQLQYEMSARGVDGVAIEAVVVLVDRGRDVYQRAAAAGVRMVSLLSLVGDGAALLHGVATDQEMAVIRDYINDPDSYQDSQVRQRLAEEAHDRQTADS